MAGLLDRLKQLYPELGEYSDADIAGAAAPMFGGSVDEAARRLGIQRNDMGFGTGLASGLGAYPVGVGRVMEDAGIPGGGAVRRYGEDVQFRNPSVGSFDELGDRPVAGTLNIIGQGLGSTAPALIPYVGPIGRGLGMTGRVAAGTAVSAVPSVGSIAATQDATGEQDLLKRYGGALAVGAVEQLGGVQRMFSPGVGARIAGATAAERAQFAASPLRTFGKQALRTGLEEGAEELAQGPIEQLAGGQDPSEHMGDTAFGGFSGFIGGLVPFGLASGMRRGFQHARTNRFQQQNLGNPEALTTDQLGAMQLQRETMAREVGPAEADAWYESQVSELIRGGIAQGLQTGQSFDLLKGTGLKATVDDQLATGGFADPATTEGAPRAIDYNTVGQPYIPNAALVELGQDVYQGLPHEAGGVQPVGMSVEEQLSRAVGVLRASVQSPDSGQMIQDVQWAQRVLQQNLAPQQYQALLREVQTPVANIPKKGTAVPKVGTRVAPAAVKQPKPAPVQKPFVDMYKASGGIYSPVQKALEEVQTPEQATEIVRNWLENKQPSQKVLHALEEMHKKLTGITMTQYLREKDKAETLAREKEKANDVRTPVLPGQQPAQGAEPVQQVQTQSPAQNPRPRVENREDAHAEAEESVMQMVLGDLAQRDPRKAAILERHLRGETDTAIAQSTGLSRERVRQLRTEAAAVVEGMVRAKGIRREQFDDTSDAESSSTLATEQEESAVTQELAPAEEEVTGDDPVANVTAQKEEGADRERTIADVAPSQQAEGDRNTGFRVINRIEDINSDKSSDEDDVRAKATAKGFEEAAAKDDDEGEAASIWDAYAHNSAAGGEKIKSWDELKKTERGQQTQKEWTEFVRQLKDSGKSDTQKNAGQLRDIRRRLKEAYYSPGKRTAIETDGADITVEPLDPFSVPKLMSAIIYRIQEGFGPLLKARLDGVYLTSVPHDDFDAAVVWQEDNGKYAYLVSPELLLHMRSDPTYAERVFQHEFEHIIDDAARLTGLYSSHPVFQKRLHARPELADVHREILSRWNGSPWVRQTFEFPVMSKYWGKLTADQDFAKELYAQVMSAYHVRQLHGRFAAELPITFKIAEDLYAAQKAKLVTETRLQTVRAREPRPVESPARTGGKPTVNTSPRQTLAGPPSQEELVLQPTADGFKNSELEFTAGREVAVIDGRPAKEYVVRFANGELGVVTYGSLGGKPSILYWVAAGRKFRGQGEKIMRALIASAHGGELLINDTIPKAVGFYERLGAQWITPEKNYGDATITFQQYEEAARARKQKPALADTEQRAEAPEGRARETPRKDREEVDPYEPLDEGYLRLQAQAEARAAELGMSVDQMWDHIWDGNWGVFGARADEARDMQRLQESYWRDLDLLDGEQERSARPLTMPAPVDSRSVVAALLTDFGGNKKNAADYAEMRAKTAGSEEMRAKYMDAAAVLRGERTPVRDSTPRFHRGLTDDATIQKTKPGVDMVRMARLLGPQLYGSMSDIGPVTVKELFQNAFDALKGAIERGQKTGGEITITLDSKARTITVSDNGTGMSPETISNAFLTLAGTKKETDRASGGLGIAKMLFLFGNKNLALSTVRDGQKSTLNTSGEELMRAYSDPEDAPSLEVKSAKEPSGTTVTVTLPEKYTDLDSGEQKDVSFPPKYAVEEILRSSPLLENVTVKLRTPSWGGKFAEDVLPIGAKFPMEDYSVVAAAKFSWGKATVFLRPNTDKNYGQNVTILSNGLFQFQTSIRVNPFDPYSDRIPYVAFVNLEPEVKADSPNYPISLNRKGFSSAGDTDAQALLKYIGLLYANKKNSDEARSFGHLQVFHGDERTPQNLSLDIPRGELDNQFKINPNDKVTVADGRVFVNGTPLPPITKETLKRLQPNIREFMIDQSNIPADGLLVHDNMKLKDGGKPFLKAAREQLGGKVDDYLRKVGQVFKDLRDAAAALQSTEHDYKDITKVGVGVSIDGGYHGVNLRIPFSAIMVNPAAIRGSAEHAPERLLGTMVHEIAHHVAKNHSETGFIPELQTISVELADNGKLAKALQALRAIFKEHGDTYAKMKELLHDSENSGVSLGGDSDQTSSEGVSGRPAGRRGNGRLSGRVLGHPAQGDQRDRQGGGGGRPPSSSRAVADSDPTPRFSRGREELSELQEQAVTTIADAWAKYKPTLLTLHQLVDQFGDKLQSLKEYVSSMDKMEQRQQTLMNRAHTTLTKWQALPTVTRNAVNSLMLDATIRGIHPDEAFGQGTPNEHVTDQDEYNALKRRYDGMATDAKEVYRDVRRLLDDNWKARKEAFSRAVTTAYKKLISDAQDAGDTAKVKELTKERDKEISDHARHIASIKGPYFPLMRFGDYLVIAESKELRALQDKLEHATGKEHTDIRKEVERLKKDGKHYVVLARESAYAADKEAVRLRAQGLQVRPPRLADEHFRALQPVSAGAVDRIGDRLSAQFDKATASKVKGIITQLYISTLPEHAALQRQLRRQGVEGATGDMLRAVAQATEKDAFHLARMEFADEITGNLFKLKQESKDRGREVQYVVRNLEARSSLDFEYKPTPVQSALARMSGIWHLGMSPAYLLTNSTQPWMITAPVLAGKFGMGKTLDAMRNAWVDAANIIVQSKKGGAFADINFDKVTDAGERQALQAVMDRGQITITQNVDMGMIADGMDPKFMKAQKAFEWTNHHIEASNRIVTALAAYRLARKDGMTQQAAQDYAFKQVVDTQLNYTNANAAYWMKTGVVPLGKLIFQFRKYQQGMLYLLARNAQLAFQGDKDAQRALAYLAASQMVMAGAVGLPVVTAPLAAASLFLGGGDDEKGDLETQLRNGLADLMGPEAARAFWKGLPNLVGVDVSKRLGMGDMWKPLPYLRLTGKTGQEDMAQLVTQSLGAPFGMLGRMLDSVNFFKKGDWQRGTEQLLPKMLSDPLKAGRYADSGITTRSGTTALHPDKFDPWDIAIKAAGFSPTVESEHYTAVSAKENTARAIDERRKAIIADYANSQLRGKDTKDALKAIDEFNQDHPDKGYRIDRSTMLRAVQTRKKDAKDRDEVGVRFPKNQKSLEGMNRFAYGS
jgi:hypothetical protein